MPVSEHESGIADAHTHALHTLMKAKNCFLFLRPTEIDSTRLIKAGYATKSMDIHDKSSNWGLTAGFVPCDPAFSKLKTGTPDPNIHPHGHGAAEPVQLYMDDSLLSFLSSGARTFPPTETFLIDTIRTVHEYNKRPLERVSPSPLTYKFFRFAGVEPSPMGCTFVAIWEGGSNKIYWVHWNKPQGQDRTGKLIPLYVWAYKAGGSLKPVTGDYDMWMVAPHISAFKESGTGGTGLLESGMMINSVTDSHGESAATKYTTDLISSMNLACGRADNPVFNHGAEAQNYGFTQKLDMRVAMYTPAGTSKMVDMSDMPKVVADLINTGYLAILNKRYAELDPTLMGRMMMFFYRESTETEKPDFTVRDSNGTVTGYVKKSGADFLHAFVATLIKKQRFLKAMQEMEELKKAKDEGTLSDSGNLARARWRFAITAVVHGVEYSRIAIFYKELDSLLSGVSKLSYLTAEDFPTHVGLLLDKARSLQIEMHRVATESEHRGGESKKEEVQAWLLKNKDRILEVLSSFT